MASRSSKTEPGYGRVTRAFWLMALVWTLGLALLVADAVQGHARLLNTLGGGNASIDQRAPAELVTSASSSATPSSVNESAFDQAKAKEISRQELFRYFCILGLLWVAGLGGVLYAGLGANKRHRERLADRAALLESENRYRRLAEATTEGILIHHDGIILEVNDAFANLIGITPEKLIGTSVLDYVVPEAREVLKQRIQARIDAPYEVTGLNTLGEHVPVEVEGRTIGEGELQARIVCVRDLRRRRQAEALLAESQQRFQSLVEKIGEGFIVVDADDRVTFSNHAADQIFGVGPSELVGCSLREFVDYQGWQLILEQDLRRRTSEVSSYELEIKRPAGDRRAVVITGSPLLTADGEYIGSFGPVIDMTDRKRSEQTLRQQRDLSFALGHARTLDEALQLCLATATACAEMDCGMVYLFDYEAEEIYLAATKDIPHEVVRNNLRFPLATPHAAIVIDGLPVYSDHATLCREHGVDLEQENVKAVAVVPILHGGKVIANLILGSYTLQEVAPHSREALESSSSQIGAAIARIQAEEALRDSEARYRELVENVGEGIVVTDAQRRIILANRAAERIFGVASGKLLGRSIREFVIAPDLPYADAQFEARRKGRSGTYELRVVRPDGKQRHLMLTASARKDKAGRYAGAFGVIRDMTEAKRIQERLFYEQKEQSLAALAGGIAHDFNNILMGMISSATVVREEAALSAASWEALHSITLSARRMSDLTSKLLSYAKGSSYQPKAILPANLVLDSLTILRGSVPSSLEIEIDVPEDLWPVEADSGQINQVLLNLYMNAIEAMQDQPGLMIIRAQNEHLDQPRECSPVGLLRAGDYVVLSVVDTGIGMDARTVSRVFEPFFSTKSHGRGLGLSAVQGIVQLHEGAIDVASQVGHGSTFHLYLKRADEALVQELPSRYPAAARSSVCLKDTAVLFVDDEPDIRMMVSRMLQRRGYRVYAAGDGPTAIELFQKHAGEIGVAVLDMQMPHMSGAELLGHLRHLQPELPAVLSSGYPLEIDRANIQGIWSALLQKPYDFDVLLSTLQEVIAQADATVSQ